MKLQAPLHAYNFQIDNKTALYVFIQFSNMEICAKVLFIKVIMHGTAHLETLR